MQSQFISHIAGINTIKINTSSITASDYYLNCSFTSGPNKFTIHTSNKIKMFSNIAINISSISPAENFANSEFDLTLQGSGFPNCSELRCITQSGISLKATMDSASKVRCHIPRMSSGLLKISLAFSTKREFDVSKYAAVSIFLYAANVTLAKFQNNLGAITFTLDADSYTSNTSCSAFVKNISKLGDSPKCALTNARHLTVYLGRAASIVTGDVLVIMLTSINRNGITKYPIQEQSISVFRPDRPIVPQAVLVTSEVVGESHCKACFPYTRNIQRPVPDLDR